MSSARNAARFDRPNLPRESVAAASHAAVLAQPKKIRGGTEPTKLAEYRLHFCGAKAPLFLHEMQKTKENAIGTEAAQPPEYPADYFPLSTQSAAAFLPSRGLDLAQIACKLGESMEVRKKQDFVKKDEILQKIVDFSIPLRYDKN